jgi:hypothetical protein
MRRNQCPRLNSFLNPLLEPQRWLPLWAKLKRKEQMGKKWNPQLKQSPNHLEKPSVDHWTTLNGKKILYILLILLSIFRCCAIAFPLISPRDKGYSISYATKLQGHDRLLLHKIFLKKLWLTWTCCPGHCNRHTSSNTSSILLVFQPPALIPISVRVVRLNPNMLVNLALEFLM